MDAPRATALHLLTLQVTRRDALAEDIVAFELRDPSGGDLPPFQAGAHIDLHLPVDGVGAPACVRSYSLCNAPAERRRYLIAVQCEHAGRGGSRWLHQHLKVGDLLAAGAPRNLFALRPAPHTVLLAGGIGLTPLLAMAEALSAADRSFELHVAVRSRARLPFAQRLQAAPFAAQVHVHADDAVPAWSLADVLARQSPQAMVYTCGPAGFMAAVQRSARSLGWADRRVVVEHFAPPPADACASPPGGFDLLWAPTGQPLRVAPEQSVAQALMAAGIAVALSCEQGICGQCCLQVLDGTPEHRDLVYSAEEHDTERRFTPCCSRAASPRLVLAPLGWQAPA